MMRRDDLIDIPERRSVPVAEFEVRVTGNTAHVEGYASIFDKGYDIYGGPDAGGFTEYVSRGAFDTTLKAKPDVVLLENHTGGPLARTKSGTLGLATDSTGLISTFDLDMRDPQAKSVWVKLDRKDYDEMSFAFRVKKNTWSEDDTQRHLDEVSLHKGDVSIVNFGANPFTSVGLRSAVKMLARDEFSDEQLAELRTMSDQVDRAMEALRIVRSDGDTGAKNELIELIRRAVGDEGVQGGPDNDDGGIDSLVEAIHDLIADAVGCTPPVGDTELASGTPTRGLTISAAKEMRSPVSKGNLTITEAMRLRRPEGSPDPLTVDQAAQLRAS